tara:strand:- start:2687 stop:2896 length:210 start_codon:yes stop_codon:yes gene_type:complete
MSNLRVTSLRGRSAGSSPTLPDGAVVTGVTTSTTFDGNVTGDVNAGIVTATQYVGLPEGTNVLKSMLFV